MQQSSISWFNDLTLNDIDQVGGKNASLGEMINHLVKLGIKVPNGFATTASAFRDFLHQDSLDQKIYSLLDELDIDDVDALAQTGEQIRSWILQTPFLPQMQNEVEATYRELEKEQGEQATFAVRSSATAEDLPTASFAGQQETILNVKGLDAIFQAIKEVYASLFNDRAIAYRVHQSFPHNQVAISVGVQRMVRSDLAASGVVFTLDTESGFEDIVFITSAYGLGETVVQGSVNPDEFYVHKSLLAEKRPAIIRRNRGSKAIKMIYTDDAKQGKTVATIPVDNQEQLQFSLNDAEIELLAKQAVLIQNHYGRHMDIEWAKDGLDGHIYILQARPETVKSQGNKQVLEHYELNTQADIIVSGRSIGQRIGKGTARVIRHIEELSRVEPGDVLISDMTDPDWEPVMKKAAAIVTNRGGRTCHAAIIARELGIPAVVGCGDATKKIKESSEVTVSCASGEEGYVYQGLLDFTVNRMDIDNVPELPLKVMLNIANPERAFAFRTLPNSGVGLARLEFIISNMIGIHPKALLNYDSLPADVKEKIAPRIAAYENPIEYYIEKLREAVATIAVAFSPHPVIVRFSDFKSNEYANLLGGQLYEPEEENPMLGFRGASRYIADDFRDCFVLECEAIKRVRNEMGLTNVEVMIPFVRTVTEAEQVIEVLSQNGLRRGDNSLRIIMMCELPNNALLAEEYLRLFDGFSIGSNDLTQLTLGIDRDSALVAPQFDERNLAVKKLLHQAISACKSANKYIGICGQGPSDHKDFAEWLMEEGIDSISLNPDSVLETTFYLAQRA